MTSGDGLIGAAALQSDGVGILLGASSFIESHAGSVSAIGVGVIWIISHLLQGFPVLIRVRGIAVHSARDAAAGKAMGVGLDAELDFVLGTAAV